jgi:hypothetical protein
LDSTGGVDVEHGRVARRALLKKAAIAGAVVWTAPVVIESVTNPAGALTCGNANYYVTLAMSGGSLVDISADLVGSGCTHTGTAATRATVGMTATFTGACTPADNPVTGLLGSIAHDASTNGNCQPLTISVTGGCTCTITNVYAHVHRRGAPTSPDCPNPACQQASTTSTNPFRGSGFGTNTATVYPNYDSNLCSTEGIHWGSPSKPNGYLVVNIHCTA